MSKVHDFRNSRWGHSMQITKKSPKVLRVCGCLTPLPENGDYAIESMGYVYKFSDVELWHNPRDGFAATLTYVGMQATAGYKPTLEEIKSMEES